MPLNLAVLAGLLAPLRSWGAFALVLLLLWYSYRRIIVSDDDPSVAVNTESTTGSMSFMASGTKLIALIAGVVMLLVPDYFAANPGAIGVLVAIVVVHYFVERREATS